ncbi:MAG: lytic transglycosylase domain-containing protein [Gammaproteobacteria bacterium]|nr:lytic transglycosylase domain-containing protein [Gammaproteobacteria bacterium]
MKNFLRDSFKLIIILLLLQILSFNSLYAAPNYIDQQLKNKLKQAFAEGLGFTDKFHAEVWLKDMATRLDARFRGKFEMSKNQQYDFLTKVHNEATKAKLDPELVLSVIQVESNFDKFAISSAGARGLMQIMPFWLKEIGKPNDNLFDISTNLRFGCTILKYYLDIEKGNLTRALARYNGSLGRYTYPRKVYKALDRTWFKS